MSGKGGRNDDSGEGAWRTKAAARALVPGSERPTVFPPILWMPPVILWAALFNVIGWYTWGFGPLTFAAMMSVVLLLQFQRPISALLSRRLPRMLLRVESRWMRGFLLVIVAILGVHFAAGTHNAFTNRPDLLIDISANTYSAGDALLKGENPYESPIQFAHEIEAGPNVEVSPQGVRMFGVPYYYGYPYFPVMFLTYLPFRALVEGYASIRLANVLFVLMNMAGVSWLAWRLSSPRARLDAALLSVAAYLCIRVYVQEIVYFGIVDILVSAFALYAFIAITYDRNRTAGILVGLAQASKLLPGPLIVLSLLMSRFRGMSLRGMVIAYAITSLAFILPFVLLNPQAFLSASILFYLTNHAVGDDTALWFFLPDAMKPIFTMFGAIATPAVILWASRTRRNPVLSAVAASFLGYMVFVAFARMTHLNYLWGIYPLGCVVMAVQSVSETR